MEREGNHQTIMTQESTEPDYNEVEDQLDEQEEEWSN